MHSSTPMFHIKLFACIVSFFLSFSAADASQECEQLAGELVSIQGEAQLLRKGKTAWDPIGREQLFCPGDMLRTAANSRATVVLPNETILRIDQETTLSFPETVQEKPLLLQVMEGVLHIFSHRPRSLQVNTPFVNGAVEGTEFLVNVGLDNASITVFKGLISAANEQGTLRVTEGQTVLAAKGKAPEYSTVVQSRDAINWTLYYPVIPVTPAADVQDNSSRLAHRASEKLVVGRIDEAQKIISEILEHDSRNSEALALKAIIEVVRNDTEQALDLASRAVEANPQSTAAALALSYAQQANFDIPGALDVLEKASRSHPGNAQILARLAELQLSAGELDSALRTAQDAVNIDPQIGRTQAVLGFAHLARVETERAIAAFSTAIALDQTLPLARLGLGLAKIRNGDLEGGRADIEIAAALDPGSALIRSYLGKAYFEEKRDDRSRRQYELAKTLDPADPTPWFYDAIRKQTTNRPVEALHDLQKSIALNDNRAVFRSRLLLDEDLAARSASLGRIYSDLGFQQLALVEGRKSVNTDPANFSAHRFLADTYSTLPRHEIARVSELLQSQLLQPLSITPVQPQLAESSLAILEGAGPSTSSFNEFNPLFLRNRLALQASGVVGDNDTFGDELVQSGVWNRFSYSLGQFYYQTDGFRKNNDQEQNVYNAFLQGIISHNTSLMSELRYRKKTSGDPLIRFDPTDYSRTLRQTEETKSLRLGIRHDLHPGSTLIGTAIISSDDNSANGLEEFSVSVDIANKADNLMAEVQHLYSGYCFNLTTGAGIISADETESMQFIFPFSLLTEEDTKTDHLNVYTYGQISMPFQTLFTVGLSGDVFDSPVENKDELNPKFGITWQPLPDTTLRTAAFRTLQRRFIYAQTIEPTQVSGFNQFYNDFEAVTAWNYGIGLDHKFSPSLYVGLQFVQKDLQVPFTAINPMGFSEQVEDDWEEQLGSAYLYWAPHPWFAFGAEYQYEDYFHEQWEGPKGIQNLTTHRVTPKINFIHSSGVIARLQASYVDQEGDFGSNMFGFTRGSDQFWVVDASIGYRLPRRHGIVNLEVKNLFDEQFQFLDTDSAHPKLLPEMQIIFSLTLSF